MKKKIKIVKDSNVWQDMDGHNELEKKINSHLTSTFVTKKDVPADECLDSARSLAKLAGEYYWKKIEELEKFCKEEFKIRSVQPYNYVLRMRNTPVRDQVLASIVVQLNRLRREFCKNYKALKNPLAFNEIYPTLKEEFKKSVEKEFKIKKRK